MPTARTRVGTYNSWVSSFLSMARPCSEMTTLSVLATRGVCSDAPLLGGDPVGISLRGMLAMLDCGDAPGSKCAKTSNDFAQHIPAIKALTHLPTEYYSSRSHALTSPNFGQVCKTAVHLCHPLRSQSPPPSVFPHHSLHLHPP